MIGSAKSLCAGTHSYFGTETLRIIIPCEYPNAISPFFETKFARLEYASDNRFHLSFMRYTEEWVELYQGLSLEACLKVIQEEPYFRP